MADTEKWTFPADVQPKPEETQFDLARAFDAMVMVRSEVPEKAMTASGLGTERAGYGVVIQPNGLILTIGYLITEATQIWLTTNRGGVVAGHPLAFDQAMSGAEVPVTLERHEACGTCAGSGAKPGSTSRLCTTCDGRGSVTHDVGGFSIPEECPSCGGQGTVVEDPCTDCYGRGTRTVERRIRVRIPAGAKDGTRIKLKGKGGAGMRGGPAGDLHVITRVMPSPLFKRKGDDLTIEVPVTFAEAALGAKVEVPTLDGRVAITVPAGSQDGRTLRVPGKGAPKLDGSGNGSLLAKIKLTIPSSLSDEQQEALKAFSELDTSDPRARLFS
jgi:molecular chaperone DnaJ